MIDSYVTAKIVLSLRTSCSNGQEDIPTRVHGHCTLLIQSMIRSELNTVIRYSVEGGGEKD